jgi:hypothetical protein
MKEKNMPAAKGGLARSIEAFLPRTSPIPKGWRAKGDAKMPSVYPVAQPKPPVTTTLRSSDPVLEAEVQVLTTAMEKAVANIVAQSGSNTAIVRRLLALEQKVAQLPASREARRGS